MSRKTPDRVSLRAFGLFIIAVLGVGLVWVLLAPPRASAATFTVTKTADTNDGVCDSDCSLREAIAAANVAPGDDVITLPAGTYTLTLGSLSIASNLTLTGVLSSTTIINGMPYYGVLQIGTGSIVTISNLTITGGTSIGAGGINIAYSAAVTLNDSAVVNNAGLLGGGIQNGGGTLIINRSAIVGNTTGLVLYGGGINSWGTLIISDSLIANNTAGNGGGIANGGVLTISNTILSGNVAYNINGGGGIDNGGLLTIANSPVYDNRSIDFGGGVANYGGTVVISGSRFFHNSVAAFGGGVFNQYGSLTVSNSVFSVNTGNGIYSSGALTLTNSTLSGNRIAFDARSGSGLYTDNPITGTTTLNNITLADNEGYGIYQAGSQLLLKNTLIAGNTSGDCVGVLTSQDYNLIQNPAGCTVTGTTTHNLTGQNPLLGFLQDNGGNAFTHPLLSGSPALDAGNPASPGSGGNACEATDQRGVVRPVGAACDIGGSEGSFLPLTNIIFSQRASALAGPPGLGLPLTSTVGVVGFPLTYTIAVTNVGGSVITGVRVTDTLPASVSLASVTTTQGSCGLFGPNAVVCGPLSLNGGAVLTVAVVVTPSEVTLLLNTVRVTTAATGPATVNTTLVEPTSVNLLAQDGAVSLPGVSHGAVAWGDYNNDNRLDVLLIGNTGSARIAKIYRNDGDGIFTGIGAPLLGVDFGSVAWGDYNNDGQLDILLTGFDGTNAVTRIYRNDGDGQFADTGAALAGVQNGTGAWGDYNNDGSPDIVLTGQSASGPITKIYRSDGSGVFTDINAALPGVYDSTAAWGDYDNDGDPDLVLSGDTGSTRFTKIYRNDDGLFLDSGFALGNGLGARGSVAWGDYNNDGNLDILLASCISSPSCDGGMTTYRNDGNDVFSYGLIIPAGVDDRAAWGDYNNDGNLDIALGSESGLSTFYENRGNGIFGDARANFFVNTMAWGDANNDGNLDLLAPSYIYAGGMLTTLYRNYTPVHNTPPTPPTGLSATASGTTALLSWNASSDAQTPANGLTYNLLVGTTPGGSNVLAPMADPDTGYRNVPQLGNAGPGVTATLNLPFGGTFYWSVQAIDSAFAGSPFSSEGSFTISGPPAVMLNSNTYSVGEGAGAAIVTATLTVVPTQTVTVSYTTSSDTALADSDYLTATGTLTFDPGVTAATFTVPIINDALIEGNETVRLTLSAPVGALLGQPDAATLMIVDDDPTEHKLYLPLIGR